jgi:hypothetical protein
MPGKQKNSLFLAPQARAQRSGARIKVLNVNRRRRYEPTNTLVKRRKLICESNLYLLMKTIWYTMPE